MNYTDLSDRELARHSLDGDERAARELVERFRRPVFSLVYRMVQDRELAEDLTQETFVRAFDALESYDPTYKISSWLFKIGHNLTIDHLRKGQLDTVSIHGAPDATSQEEQEATRVTLESREERPDQYTESQLLGEEIERAVAHLRPDYREAVLLRHVEGYAYDEIAQIMDVPLGTVKTYIHRARKELRRELAHLRE